MTGDRMGTAVLAAKLIPNADAALLRALGAREGERSLGLFTADCDDVSYAALDEATKHARVRVAYARSMYAGASNASSANTGEFLGILAGPDPEEVRSGLAAARRYALQEASFISARDDDGVVYFAHCISRTGSYLSQAADISPGEPLAYLIAPPMEAMLGLDAALKQANVTLRVFYGPPTETNFAGGLLTGARSDCAAACEAFAAAVRAAAQRPLDM